MHDFLGQLLHNQRRATLNPQIFALSESNIISVQLAKVPQCPNYDGWKFVKVLQCPNYDGWKVGKVVQCHNYDRWKVAKVLQCHNYDRCFIKSWGPFWDVEVVVDGNTWGGIPGGVCMKCQKSISLVNKCNLTPRNWASKQMMSCTKKISTGFRCTYIYSPFRLLFFYSIFL